MSNLIINPFRFGAAPAPGPGDASSDYDGTNDYATRGSDLTGAADGKAFAVSFWIDLNGGDAASQAISSPSGGTRFLIIRTTANQFRLLCRNTSNTIILDVNTVSTYVAADGWTWFGGSANLATPETYMFTNTGSGDTDDADTPVALTDDTIDMTEGDSSVGARADAGLKSNACISEFWYDDSFLDFSVEATRRKFITAGGKPVDLGSDGSTPTGGSPLVYAPDGDPSTNAGTGGNFTITGTLTACASNPGD